MKNTIKTLVLLGFLVSQVPLLAQNVTQQPRTPFDEFPLAAPQVSVYQSSLFSAYKGPSVARLNVDVSEERSRLGIVSVAPSVTAYVDRIDNLVHGNSFFEISEVKAGAVLGKFDLGFSSASANERLLFNGQGVVYLHHVPTSVCFGSTTRKFLLTGKRLIETKQALGYLGVEAKINGEIKLFSSQDASSLVVASLQDGATVTVIGIAADSIVLDPKNKQYLPTLLVKTPLGLTGWYLPGRSGKELSAISITQCN